jgi:hypothetical protein
MNNTLGVIFGLLLLSAGVAAQAAEERVAGEIVKLDGSRLEIKTGDGKLVPARLAPDVRLSARSRASRAQLVQGAFVGATAAPRADGTLVASEVHIYPESMRGRGEGHRPMAGLPGSTMTNATIARVGASLQGTMTGASVAQVAGAPGGHSLTLAYKGGEKTVFVPDDTPVVMVAEGDRSQLIPGAHVIVYGSPQPDGALAATRVTVGLDGLVPPI